MKPQSLINIIGDSNVPELINPKIESPTLEQDAPDGSEVDFSLDERDLLPLNIEFPADKDLTKNLKGDLEFGV